MNREDLKPENLAMFERITGESSEELIYAELESSTVWVLQYTTKRLRFTLKNPLLDISEDMIMEIDPGRSAVPVPIGWCGKRPLVVPYALDYFKCEA